MVYVANFRECVMPESPDIKVSSAFQSSHSPKTCAMAGIPPLPTGTSRPLSSNSSISGLNGSHSPQSATAMNGGRTPSPPTLGSLMNSTSGQQLPPACGARQLSKLKRFLTTLQQFGSDISPEIGERVRTLVLGLVNSHLSIEEFHGKLQEATNFPLRPFVIPFLKANLPLLQRELHHCARIAKQSPQQFLTQNEQILFDPTHSPLDSRDNLMADINENGKRRSSPDSRPKENGLDLHIDAPPHPAKRHHGSHPVSPVSMSRTSPGSTFNLSTGGPIRLEDISKSRELREREARERMEREQVDRARERERERDRDRERHFSNYSFRSSESYEHLERLDDDWRHVETMLNCIIGMVDKTKRAMSVLQERSMRDREESLWARRQADVVGIEAADVKKRSGDVMAYTIRQRAEAVNDVKRQAMVELQKALSAADQKAAELVSAERAKMERAISETRKQAQTELLRTLNHQEESAESCWNCGRKASETCSGCNVARYCGPFCQHKDWENHHHVCGKAHITSAADAREIRRAAAVAAAAAAAAASSSSGSSSSTSKVTVAASSSLATSSSILSPSSTASATSASASGLGVPGGSSKGSKDSRDQSPSTSTPSSSKSPPASSSATSKVAGDRERKTVSCSSPAPLVVPSLSGRSSPVKPADSRASSPGGTLSPVPSDPATPTPGDSA